jgi:hypothetical protein
MTESSLAGRADGVAPIRLGPALLWVIAAAIAAQLAGGLVADFLRALLETRGAKPAQLEHAPMVVIPALFASGSALLAVVLFAPLVSGVPARVALGLRSAPASAFALAGLGTVALGPTGDWLMRWMAEQYPGATLGVVPMLNELVERTPLYVVLPAFALMPAASEELAFRGLLQNAGGPWRLRLALSAALFALFHVDPHHVVGVLPLGIFLAWVGGRYGALVTIAAHVLNNTLAIVTVRMGHGSDEVAPLPWLFASWLIVIGCIVGLARARVADKPADQPLAV